MNYQLFHGDCLAHLRSIDSQSVDATICDPPYNVGFEYSEYNDVNDQYEQWCAEWMAELKRVTSGVIAISVGQANLSMWARIAPPTWWIAWWKPSAMGRCVVGFNNWEPIAVYGKPKKAGCDVIRAMITPDATVKGHPCPKPKEWAIKQIEAFTEPSDTVLDIFMGSGTTGVGCVELDRNYMGIELDADYFALSKKNIERAYKRVNGYRLQGHATDTLDLPLFA